MTWKYIKDEPEARGLYKKYSLSCSATLHDELGVKCKGKKAKMLCKNAEVVQQDGNE